MTPDEILKAADHASSHDDRYLMIVMFIILVIFAGFVIRWLMHSNEQQRSAHAASQTQLQDVLTGVVKENSQVLGRVGEVLKNVERQIMKAL